MLVKKLRLAFVVTHPIQYYVPLYQWLAAGDDAEVKVFFTWHAGEQATQDQGFKRDVAWDIPLTEGYHSELVPNSSRDPGSHRFLGIRNPGIVSRICEWKPDAVVVTGYAFESHLRCMVGLSRRGIPVLFRGDSHLLNRRVRRGWRAARQVRRWVLRHASLCLYVGSHNRAYFEDAGVPREKLAFCPHSIDVRRFAEPNEDWERDAAQSRSEFGIPADRRVLLYAGKFEPVKRPLELMQAVSELDDANVHLVMAGDGELASRVRERAAADPARFTVLPFQNQSRMPALLRMGDVFCLPSESETWGLAVNEALACGRPVLVSDRVGCAPDVVQRGLNGDVFAWSDWGDFRRRADALLRSNACIDRDAIRSDAARYSIEATATALLSAAARAAHRA